MQDEYIHSNCRFCAIAQGHTFNGYADMPIDRDDHYYSIASIGALVEGWTLVVPRRHCLSLSADYGQPPFEAFIRRTVANVEVHYGRTVVFEHGANRPGSPTSCGTDHAHLHIVPLLCSLEELVSASNLGPWLRTAGPDIQDRVGNGEYLFFSDDPHQTELGGFLHILESPVSQYFRKLVAHHVGKASAADYKTHLFLDAAQRTRQRLSVVG